MHLHVGDSVHTQSLTQLQRKILTGTLHHQIKVGQATPGIAMLVMEQGIPDCSTNNRQANTTHTKALTIELIKKLLGDARKFHSDWKQI
jgi:hypothetical protein